VSEGVHKVKPCSGRLFSRFCPRLLRAMACDPDASSEIVGRESGARTCLHVCPWRLTMLECRFNKTTHHHPRVAVGGGGGGGGGVYLEPYTRGRRRRNRTRAEFLTRWDQRAVAQRLPEPVSRRDPHPGLPVPAVDLSLPFALSSPLERPHYDEHYAPTLPGIC
jgi:hypothetical protein